MPVVDSWVEVSDEQQAANAAPLGAAVTATTGLPYGVAAAAAPTRMRSRDDDGHGPAHPGQGRRILVRVREQGARTGGALPPCWCRIPRGRTSRCSCWRCRAPSSRRSAVNRRGAARANNAVNVLAAQYKKDTAGRHAEYVAYDDVASSSVPPATRRAPPAPRAGGRPIVAPPAGATPAPHPELVCARRSAESEAEGARAGVLRDVVGGGGGGVRLGAATGRPGLRYGPQFQGRKGSTKCVGSTWLHSPGPPCC